MSARSGKTPLSVLADTVNPNAGHNTNRASAKEIASSTDGWKQQVDRRPFQLPAPFTARPRIGSRIFVQSHFPGIAGALAAEMLSWQQDTRFRYSSAPVVRSSLQLHLATKATVHANALLTSAVCLCETTGSALAYSTCPCLSNMSRPWHKHRLTQAQHDWSCYSGESCPPLHLESLLPCDLSDAKADGQVHIHRAVELLVSCLMFTEEQVSQHLPKLLPALCEVCTASFCSSQRCGQQSARCRRGHPLPSPL